MIDTRKHVFPWGVDKVFIFIFSLIPIEAVIGNSLYGLGPSFFFFFLTLLEERHIAWHF